MTITQVANKAREILRKAIFTDQFREELAQEMHAIVLDPENIVRPMIAKVGRSAAKDYLQAQKESTQ